MPLVASRMPGGGLLRGHVRPTNQTKARLNAFFFGSSTLLQRNSTLSKRCDLSQADFLLRFHMI